VSLPSLGVGIVYLPELEPLLLGAPDLISVVEIEPQTLWLYAPRSEQPYRFMPGSLDRLRRLPQVKLVHGVGFPVGGTHPPDATAIALFRETIETLSAPWASEHLAFNRAGPAHTAFNTGFLLPPLLSTRGVDAAARRFGPSPRACRCHWRWRRV